MIGVDFSHRTSSTHIGVDFSHRGVIYSVAKRYSSEVNDINLFLVTGVEFSYRGGLLSQGWTLVIGVLFSR